MDVKGKKVLLIDTNPAVQALTSLALREIGIVVESVTDPANAIEKFSAASPDLVLCAHPIKEADGLALVQQLRERSKEREVRFVVLAPSSTAQSFADTARAAGVDRVIIKPFKSAQLRDVVATLLGSESAPTKYEKNVILVTQDRYLEKLLRRFLEKYELGTVVCTTREQALELEKKRHNVGVIYSTDCGNDLTWCSDKQALPSVVILRSNDKQPNAGKKTQLSFIVRPLSHKKLLEALSPALPALALQNGKGNKLPPFAPGDQARAASKISAAIFEQLLTDNALKEKNWKKVTRAISDTITNITKDIR